MRYEMNKILTKSIGPDEMVQGIGVALLPISTPMRSEADSKLERISWGKGDSFFHERTCSESVCLQEVYNAIVLKIKFVLLFSSRVIQNPIVTSNVFH